MSLTLERCATCGALVDAEDLFCSNCGTEVPNHHAPASTRLAIDAKNFKCRGCGASMNYDAGAQRLKCPFCGSVDLAEDESKGLLAPDCVIPFALDRVEAENRLRAWLGSSFWHPNDLRSSAQLTELRAVFVPFWVFSTDVQTHWTADTSRTPPGARADWFPIAGSDERHYDDIWIPASAGLNLGELERVDPFDVSTAVEPDRVDLEAITVEQITVSRRYARPLAQARLEMMECDAIAQGGPDRLRNIHVNALMEGATSRAALAPVYVLAYRYREKVYRFVINGQTGRSTGRAPVSASKVAAVIGAILLLLLIGLLLIAH